MRNILILLTCLMLTIFAVACSPVEDSTNLPPDDVVLPNEPMEEEAGQKQPFEGKIAIITPARDADTYWATALPVIYKYGENRIIHVKWPGNFMSEQEQMKDMVEKLGKNLEIKAIIINPVIPGTNAAIDKLKETREDIFIVYCEPHENQTDVAQRADLILAPDEVGMGSAMVEQAQRLGATTFVHYSFPRYLGRPIISSRLELIKNECAKLNIKFVNATSPDPTSDAGRLDGQQFLLEDVQKKVEEYGTDTAFFCTDCTTNISLIQAVLESGAIYPQSCHPSPNHGFPFVLKVHGSEESGTKEEWKLTIDQTREILAEKNMLNRFSTWPISAAMVETVIGAEYAIKWINGEVPKEGIDVEVLQQMMEDYAGVEVYLTPYTDEYPYTENGTGETHENFLLMRMDYITY